MSLYETLGVDEKADPLKRQQYDETGDTSTTDQNRAFQMAIDIFFAAADGDPAQLGKRMAAIVKDRKAAVEKTQRETENDMRLCRELLERIKERPENDFLSYALNGKLKTTQQGLDYGKAIHEDIVRAGEMLGEYVFVEREETARSGVMGSMRAAIEAARASGQTSFTWAGSTTNTGG